MSRFLLGRVLLFHFNRLFWGPEEITWSGQEMGDDQFSQGFPLWEANTARTQRDNNRQGKADKQVGETNQHNAQKWHDD